MKVLPRLKFPRRSGSVRHKVQNKKYWLRLITSHSFLGPIQKNLLFQHPSVHAVPFYRKLIKATMIFS